MPVSHDRPKRKALPVVQESVARKQDEVQSRSSLDRAKNVLIRKIEDDSERTTRQQLDDIEQIIQELAIVPTVNYATGSDRSSNTSIENFKRSF